MHFKKVDEDSISQNFDIRYEYIFERINHIQHSSHSSYDKNKQIFKLKETTIHLFKDNKPEYIIT